MCGCKSPRPEAVPQQAEADRLGMVRKAVAFRTNGNYADNVMIRVAPDGNLIYFPAPSDITSRSASLPLVNGWLLDRQGAAGSNTAFLKYTYSEYKALEAVPSPEELKSAIIPGARVTETEVLPYPFSDAESHIGEIKQLLTDHKVLELSK